MESLQSLIATTLGRLNEKQRAVITHRYGLGGGKPQTLEHIGRQLVLTRERIRQIENSALNLLRDRAILRAFEGILSRALTHLKEAGGVMREPKYVAEVSYLIGSDSRQNATITNIVEFLFHLYGRPLRSSEHPKYHVMRYLEPSHITQAKEFLAHLEKQTRQHGVPMDGGRFCDALHNAMKASKIRHEGVAIQHLGISKLFAFNSYGEFGLRTWPEIEPRGVREKAYLVLKKHREPLHFQEISVRINQAKFDRRLAQPQTVHNELIKDQRFVLCGRGMYGLREWGLEPGTVKDVLKKLLKQEGPLASYQIVELVKQQRLVKDSTILLSLQDKNSFKRLDDGRYKAKLA